MKNKEKITELKGNTCKKKFCPFTRDPFEDCYCAETTALKTWIVLYYCGGHFEECEIYRYKNQNQGNREVL